MTRYLIDSNVFIQAKNQHYGFDFCPAFWDWLVQQNNAGKVASIKSVADELLAGNDELMNWARARASGFFLNPDGKVFQCFSDVSDWANGNGYQSHAINTFLKAADSWLIAHAKAHGYVVVTHEVPSNSTKKIKIPNACDANKVKYTYYYEMLRQEGARFKL